MRHRLALNLCLAIIFLASRSSPSATPAVILRRPQFSVGFLFQRTVSINQRPCSCPNASSCSCCQSVTILLRGVVRNFCVNFDYRQTGLAMSISLGSNVIRRVSIIDYSTFKVCTAIPDCPFSSACVEVLELSNFPRSITICLQLDVTSKIENWLINYNCISISTVLTNQSNTGATTIASPTTTNIVLNGTTGMNVMQPMGMMPGTGQMNSTGQMPMGQPGQMPMGQMPSGQMPMGQPGQMPSGQMPMGQMPMGQPGQMPMGQMPAAQTPSGQMPSGQMPMGQPGQMPSGQMPMGQMPSGQMPSDQMPMGQPGQMPSGQMPMGQMPMGQPGQMPMGQMPAAQMPSGQMPSGQMPMGQPGQMPSGQMPSGQMPMGQMPMGQPGQMPMGQMPMGQPGQMPMGQMPPRQMQGMVIERSAPRWYGKVMKRLREENLKQDGRFSIALNVDKKSNSQNMILGKADHRSRRNAQYEKPTVGVKMQVINRRRKNGLPRINRKTTMISSRTAIGASRRSSRIVNQDTISIPIPQMGQGNSVNPTTTQRNNDVYYELRIPQSAPTFPPYVGSPGIGTTLMDNPISTNFFITYDNRTSSFPNRMPPSFSIISRIGPINENKSSSLERSVEELVTPKLQVELGANSKIVEVSGGDLSDGRIIFPE